MDFDHDLPRLGDILLLRGKSLLTKPNMAIQSITRLQIASYSHVAMVTGQNMIIDANPGIGITLRQWDEVSHSYDIANSLLVRHRYADDAATWNLLEQAQYYYGQKYKIIALISNEAEFSDNEGIVCSQFIAQIFQDCALPCSGKSCRKSLPTDIYTFTKASSEWVQRPLSEIRIGISCRSSEIAHSIVQVNHQMDNYIAASLKQAFDLSRQFHELTADIAGATDLINVANGGLIPLAKRMEAAATSNISIEHFSKSWRQYFLEPRAKATFLHEAGTAAEQPIKIFIKTCEIVKQHNTAADNASKQLNLLLTQLEHISKSLPATPSDIEIQTWVINHLEIRKELQRQIDILDWIIISSPGNLDFAKSFDFQAFMEEYDKDPKPDFNEAIDTLVIIADYCRHCNSWAQQRPLYEQIMSAHHLLGNVQGAALHAP